MKMPEAETYDDEMLFMPWGRMLEAIAAYLGKVLPEGASVVDLMCGTGYLLRLLSEDRPDLELRAVDLNEDYLALGCSSDEGNIFWDVADARGYREDADCVICTGGIHHLRPEEQGAFVKHLAELTKPDGLCVVAEHCLAPYEGAAGRLYAIEQLNRAYIDEMKVAGAPADVIEASYQTLRNDLEGEEYKMTLEQLLQLVNGTFGEITMCAKRWPEISPEIRYGDYQVIARDPIRRRNDE